MHDRLTRTRDALGDQGLDGLLISSPREEKLGHANKRYLCGFTGSAATVLVTADRAIVAADFRYVEQAKRECGPRGFEVFPALEGGKKWLPELFGHAGVAGKRLGLSTNDLTHGGYLAMKAIVAKMPPPDRPKLVAGLPIVEHLRLRKDAEELALLQRAIDIGDAAFEAVSAAVEPGQTEDEIARALEAKFVELGGDGPSFPPIVAAGPWGAMPHASPRNEAIRVGEPLVVDMGARAGGYCSDLTRTFTISGDTPKFREIYGIVFEAQRNAIERVETGMTGPQAHSLAFDVVAAAGYGEQFGHGLGHGIGLEVHEAPYLGPSSEDTLEDGMVFTIEPGIYLPGWGGVRIEDVVVLENGRARVLSHASKLIPAGVRSHDVDR